MVWELISELPLTLYAPDDLIDRVVQISFETGGIIYDSLFLALAEDAETVVVTDDGKLLKTVNDTSYPRLAHSLTDIGSVVPDTR